MNAPPDAQRVARRWIAKADEDLAAAERLLAIDDSLASIVCFHSQQAVEKLLKALLVVSRVPFARTHDVIQLVQMLPAALASPIPLAELAPLNRYAVEACYPIGEEPLTGEEARSAIDVARKLRAFVLGAFAPDSFSG
jgi:HEPN domain-containing protein